MRGFQGLDDLVPDALHVLLFGPGTGESVLVGVSGAWLAIDSLNAEENERTRNPSLDALSHLTESPRVVVLTHPHFDHAEGFAALVERREQRGKVGCLPDFLRPEAWSDSPDAMRILEGAAAEAALAAVQNAWDLRAESRWSLDTDSSEPLGDATITVLSPERGRVEHAKTLQSPDFNALSTALLIEWEEVSLVLGADLTARGWADIAANRGHLALSDASCVKVPHHGSSNAQHPILMGDAPEQERLLILAPFGLGRSVPSYDEDGDMSGLLSTHRSVLVTMIREGPGALASLSRVTRADIASGTRMARFGELGVKRAPRQAASDECWLCISVNSSGDVVDVRGGDQSREVVSA